VPRREVVQITHADYQLSDARLLPISMSPSRSSMPFVFRIALSATCLPLLLSPTRACHDPRTLSGRGFVSLRLPSSAVVFFVAFTFLFHRAIAVRSYSCPMGRRPQRVLRDGLRTSLPPMTSSLRFFLVVSGPAALFAHASVSFLCPRPRPAVCSFTAPR